MSVTQSHLHAELPWVRTAPRTYTFLYFGSVPRALRLCLYKQPDRREVMPVTPPFPTELASRSGNTCLEATLKVSFGPYDVFYKRLFLNGRIGPSGLGERAGS